MIREKVSGVPRFAEDIWHEKNSDYALCLPIINEGERIKHELQRAQQAGVDKMVDIIVCDGGSRDGSTAKTVMEPLGVNTLLTKMDTGKQGAQLRMGFYWALERGYRGIITIDGNDKDSIEDVPCFIEKLEAGYDFVQGSRFITGGEAVNTPKIRYLAVRFIHAPVISLTAGRWYTDTTNAYRAYSRRYLMHPGLQPLRDLFQSYELLAYLSVRADQLGLKTCEIPVKRIYPPAGKTPTKISFLSGNWDLLRTLFRNLFGAYKPENAK